MARLQIPPSKNANNDNRIANPYNQNGGISNPAKQNHFLSFVLFFHSLS